LFPVFYNLWLIESFIMIIINFSEFRKKLKTFFAKVTEYDELVLIKRGEEKSAVLISLNQFNAMQETLHLLSTEKNRQRLRDAIERKSKGEADTYHV
jgi:antitoxin YefM